VCVCVCVCVCVDLASCGTEELDLYFNKAEDLEDVQARVAWRPPWSAAG
jgi:hypothetical protein